MVLMPGKDGSNEHMLSQARGMGKLGQQWLLTLTSDLCMEASDPLCRTAFLSLVDMSRKHAHRSAQTGFSRVISDPVKLTTEVNHHSGLVLGLETGVPPEDRDW